MGEMRVIRKFYGSSNPNVRSDLYHVEYQEDCVVLEIPGHDRIHLDPLAAKRLGECLVDNDGISLILSQVQPH